MRKLSKDQVDQKAKIADDLDKAHTAVGDAIDAYNVVLNAAREFAQEVVTEIDDYVSERSERWQAGDAASQYEEWKGEWEGFDHEDVETPESVLEDFEGLPEELP